MKKEKEIQDLLDRLGSMRALVIGDLMLDSYLWGEVERISPESPVPVVDVKGEDHRPGGAGNVALNLRALGARVSLLSLIGNDETGRQLKKLLSGSGIDTDFLVVSHGRPSTRKTRILGRNQQMIRIDREERQAIPKELEEEVLARYKKALEAQRPDLVLIQDYNKGLLTPAVIRQVTEAAREKNIFVAVDPKKENFLNYRGVDLFKPNLKELNESLGCRLDGHQHDAIRNVLESLHRHMPHGHTLLTLSAGGVIHFDGREMKHFAAHQRKVADVSGAGDTVISVAALAMAAGAPSGVAVALANLAGGLVCEEVGVVPVMRDRLLAETTRIV